MAVANPSVTPLNNIWILTLTKDSDTGNTQFSSYGTFEGHAIQEMPIIAYFSSRQGEKLAHAIFDFTPSKNIEFYSTITISAPDKG